MKNYSDGDVNDFWLALAQMVEKSEIVVDRPKGSRHPRYEAVVYPMDYGFLRDTGAIDGGGVDIWVGSATVEDGVVGILATVDLFKMDVEIKILFKCTETEMAEALNTANSGYQSAILVRRNQHELEER